MAELKQRVDPESLILFICRSAHRSHRAAAAATEAGFRDCYNVLEGFEGDKVIDFPASWAGSSNWIVMTPPGPMLTAIGGPAIGSSPASALLFGQASVAQ